MPADRAGLTHLLVPGFWGALLFSFVVAVLPQPPGLPGGDKLWHVVAFAVLASLGAAAYPASPLWRVGTVLSCYGALIELVQAIPMLGRHADALDWIADTIAVAGTLCLVAAIRKRNQRTTR